MAQPEAVGRRLIAALCVCGCLAIGCSRRGAGDVAVSWKVEPTPPVAGAATVVRVTLRHPDGTAAGGAKLTLQAHMTHPGMAPVTADVIDRSGGAYEARLELTMAGDWVLIVTGELADGRRITRELQVAGVRPAGSSGP
jgi:hypothetical protein